MSTQPMSDRQQAKTSQRQSETGWKLLALGGVLFAVGLVLMLVGSGVVDYAGVALAALASPPTVAGLALVLSGVVGRRSAEHKPFA